jgi:hypothetical protein
MAPEKILPFFEKDLRIFVRAAETKKGLTQQCPVRKLLAKKLDKKIRMEEFFS